MHHYYHAPSNQQVRLRPVNLQRDLVRLFNWVNQPHSVAQWRLNQAFLPTYQHFRKALEDRHQQLFIMSIQGEELAYGEIYYAPDDRLANFCQVSAGDYGIHLLIGPAQALGRGYAEPLLAALTDYLFCHRKAQRVLGEPDHRVKQVTLLQHKLGFTHSGQVKLAEKIASLYVVDATHFYRRVKPQFDLTGIGIDSTTWPLIHLHFPTQPSDTMVTDWLAQMTQLLARQQPCVVISTQDPDYHFSAAARRQQALWYKQHKTQLARYCLAMIRVTRDTTLITKLNATRVRQGIAFPCITAPDWLAARAIAQRLLTGKMDL